MPRLSSRITGILPSGKDGWEVHFAAWKRKQAGERIVMLSAGDHDFDTPSETVEAARAALSVGHHHYTPLPGLPRLREAMAAVSTRSTGVTTTADEIIATPGGQAALYASVQAIMDPGDHAIVIGPYYATYPGTFRASGAAFTVVDAPAETDFQPDVALIEAAITPHTRAILINTPNNPTGAIYGRGTLEALADICRRHDLWLISDEVYWSLAGPAHLSPRALPGMAERTLVVNSMSKSHGMTGWRVGWLTGPSGLVRSLISLNLVTTYGLPDFVSRAAIHALEIDSGVADIAARYAARRNIFLSALGNQRGRVRGSCGGMYVMIDVAGLASDCEAFAWALLADEAICVMPGASFGAAAAGHIRISLCQPDSVLADAARRIAANISAREA